MAFLIEDGVLKKYTEEPGVTEAVIPDGVTSIGEKAFQKCKSLTSVIMPDGVTSIGEKAFQKCRDLISVRIPDSVTCIGELAFAGCKSLTSVTIPDGVTCIKILTFADCKSLTSVTIPDSVTSIGESAFYCCESLTSVTIPDGVKSIGDESFKFCKSLTSVTIPDSVTSIWESAFYGCKSLTSVTILSDQIHIHEFALPQSGSPESQITMLRCILSKDYQGEWKPEVRSRMFSALLSAGYDEEGVLVCLKKEHQELLPYMLRYGSADAFRKILDTGDFITEENIDSAIEIAIDAGQNEITALLLDYKHRHFGCSDPSEQFML
ncbi:MAG: leucine-rich repeat domain-containing protein [Oscillospiraceae bacterium]|nr:leucine-rich repeat domain-containing protein [Oscillospiraceae bacterium]